MKERPITDFYSQSCHHALRLRDLIVATWPRNRQATFDVNKANDSLREY